MSKSLGNFKTIRDLLKEYSGEVIRYFVISNQYRKPIDFSKETLENAKKAYDRLKNIIPTLKEDGKENKKYLKEFEKAMNDDLNTPKALQVLWKLVRDEKTEGKIFTIKKMDEVFGLKLLEKEEIKVPKEILQIVKDREVARAKKDWKKSDELRDKIKSFGYSVDDTNEGAKVRKL